MAETTTLPSILPSIRSLLSPSPHPLRRYRVTLPLLFRGSTIPACLPACLPVPVPQPSPWPTLFKSDSPAAHPLSLSLSFVSPVCCPRFRLLLLYHPLLPVKTQTIDNHHHHHPSHPHAATDRRTPYSRAICCYHQLFASLRSRRGGERSLSFCLPRERTSSRYRRIERRRGRGLKFSGALSLLPGNITHPAASSRCERATRVIPHLSPFSLKTARSPPPPPPPAPPLHRASFARGTTDAQQRG